MQRKCITISYLLLISDFLEAQDSLTSSSVLAISAYLETYYSYDFSKPPHHEKAAFLYNHKRHNELNINLALIKISYADTSVRANLGLMGGTYPQYNLAGEPEMLRHLYEANAGVRLARKKELWLDAGILPSHIGFESAVSKDCWTVTRSILAENSPYYEAGIRVSYTTPNNKFYSALFILNGWQRIHRPVGNDAIGFGIQLTFLPVKNLTINSSSYLGNDKPDSIKQNRYFHNLYAVWQISPSVGITWGLDTGLEKTSEPSRKFGFWYSPLLILRYQNQKWAVAARAELYSDKKGVIVPLADSNPFYMQGYSLNLDRHLFQYALWRLESRWLKNTTRYFAGRSDFRRSNFCLTTTLSFSLNR